MHFYTWAQVQHVYRLQPGYKGTSALHCSQSCQAAPVTRCRSDTVLRICWSSHCDFTFQFLLISALPLCSALSNSYVSFTLGRETYSHGDKTDFSHSPTGGAQYSQNKSSSHTTKTSLVEPPSADIISASVFSTIDSENISMVSHMPASLLHAAASAVNSSDSIPPVT